jgi:hypothetical protein
MKSLYQLNAYRDTSPHVLHHYGSIGDDCAGVFRILSAQDQQTLTVIATNGGGWDHVSVSRGDRCPSWFEMEQVKRMFFKDDEVAMQLHVPATDHINVHNYCLHLWRPHFATIPLPPKGFV